MRKLGFGILMALLSLFVFNMDLEARKTWLRQAWYKSIDIMYGKHLP